MLAVLISSQVIEMEFGIEKRAMLLIKNDKRHLRDGMEQAIQDKIGRLGENKNCKYLGILEADTIKQEVMKEKKNKKKYFRRMGMLLETKLYCRNLINGINTWAVPLVRYSGPFLMWTREELKEN